MDPSRAGLLKRGILLFWSVWISIVVLMNVLDALKALGALPRSWQMSSGNYEAIAKVTGAYGVPHWVDFLLLLGAIFWETLAMFLFWWAYGRWRSGHFRKWRAVYLAFTVLLGLFGMFILNDEIFHAYRMEGDHRGIAVLLLASLLALQLLPVKVEE